MIYARVFVPLALILTAGMAPGQVPVPAPAAPARPPRPAPMPLPARAPMAPLAPIEPFDAFQLERDAFQLQREAFQLEREAFQLERPVPLEAPEPFVMPKPALMDPFITKFDAMTKLDGPMLLAQNMVYKGRSQSEDRLYESGQNDLDSHRYDEALQAFTQVAARAGSRSDAGWYWKAYTLNKLGRRDEAVAALTELRKAYPGSRWLDDAKALELEVKQQSGQRVSPESETDDELKLMALNGLMQSDPERAVPLIENVLKGSNMPKLKQRALYVLAVSNAPRAQQILEQVARGGGNPDLQLKAISYIGTLRRRQQGNNTTPAILPEIYASSSDATVKRAILNVYLSNRDNPHLAEVARNEKNPELRKSAFEYLGNSAGQPELWQIYQSESSPDVKEQILACMYSNGDASKLAEVARTEKDPKLRRMAVRVLASQKTPASGDTLVAIYSAEQDQQNKQTIVDTLYSQRNAKALVDLAKAEKDPKMKVRIVDRLSNMKSKEATDYLMELLSK